MFKLPNLDYPYNALEPYIDTLTMEIHHNKHHQTYTDRLNDALKDQENLQNIDIGELLKDISAIPQNIRATVVNNGGGYYNHNLYWKFMNPKKSVPSGLFLKTLETSYGSVDIFKEKFSTAALNHFGSGWGWLVTDNKKLEIISTPNQNSPVSDGKTPILGIDVWEHAYYLKYRNKRADYINAWWNVVNWRYISSLFEKYAS